MKSLFRKYSPSVFFLLIFISAVSFPQEEDKYVIIDSNISPEEALDGLSFPEQLKKNLTITDVLYYSFDNKLHKGQIVIHKELESDIKEIFSFIKESRFPVEKVIPISAYNWNDTLSMLDNNTSGFNYRKVTGTTVLSTHSKGRAVDINPLLNPQIKNGKTIPSSSVYNPQNPGTLTRKSPLVEEFLKKGWNWGGRWRSTKDYQHFEKP